jgi:hypothetical protein
VPLIGPLQWRWQKICQKLTNNPEAVRWLEEGLQQSPIAEGATPNTFEASAGWKWGNGLWAVKTSGAEETSGHIPPMSSTEILAELPKLTHQERRELARRLFELEDEAQLLADCDRRANRNLMLLDALEAEDACRNQPR